MKTKEQREQEFRKDLEELLEVHGAEMELTYGLLGFSAEVLEEQLTIIMDRILE